MEGSTIRFKENRGKNGHFTWIPFYMEMAEKLLGFKEYRKPLLDMVYSLDKKFVGYIKTEDGGQVSDIDPFTVFGIFNRGISHNNRFQLCHYFKDKLSMKASVPVDFDGVPVVNNMMATFFWREYAKTDIQPLWELFEAVLTKDSSQVTALFDQVCKQQGIKWNITMGLFWIRPYDYISLDSRMRGYLPTIGINMFKENQIDSEHYFSLLSIVKGKMANRMISEGNIPEVSYQAWISDKSSTDTVISKNYWLVGVTFEDKGSQLDRFFQHGIWESRYNESNPNDHNQLALARTIKQGDILILKSTSTKGKMHNRPFLRVKGVGIVEADMAVSKQGSLFQCTCPVRYISTDNTDFDGSIYGSYRKTIHLADSKVQAVIDYAKHLMLPDSTTTVHKYEAYVELLKETHNLVLTGSPGTGKTYMAQAIAAEMGCTKDEMCFVQFHPSYDYTDFVEGLRPVRENNGQIGFERKDGIFKEFCKKAAKNIEDSTKTIAELSEEQSLDFKYQKVIDKINNGDINEFKLRTNGKVMEVVKVTDNNNIELHTPDSNTDRTYIVSYDRLAKLAKVYPTIDSLNAISNINEAVRDAIGGCHASAYWAVLKELYQQQNVLQSPMPTKVNQKPFVFIIDEINRGEASKIFGELFYAIDPGYRGKKDIRVKTQYQNLVPDTDVFAEGFYVPENIYILATMNDIDRSVESMDFAMRRRFTWKEVTPTDTQFMLDTLDQTDDAKAAMNRLNEVITDTDGLGATYQVGSSYFLKLGDNGGNFEKLWKMNIEPLLREYLRGFRKSESILTKLHNAYFNIKAKAEETDNFELTDDD